MKRILRNISLFVLSLGVLLFLIMNIKAFLLSPSSKQSSETLAPKWEEPTEKKLAELIKIKTISGIEGKFDYHASIFEFLKSRFPNVFSKLQFREDIKEGFVFVWKSKETAKKSYLFLGHLDVVPVEEESLAQWTRPPFSGEIADGMVWGRGAFDDKGGSIALLEAMESLAKSGFVSKNDFYFAFGLDEEIGGMHSAQKISAVLAKENLKFDAAFDEGSAIVLDPVNLGPVPVAIIAVGEKGYVSFKLTVEIPGGHSSIVKPETAISVMTNALVRLQKNPPPKRMTEATRRMFEVLAPAQNYFKRLIYSNLWLTEKLILKMANGSPRFLSIVQSHYVVIQINSGLKDNVIPGVATAVVNSRILPGDTIEDVEKRLDEALGDSRVHVSIIGNFNSAGSAISSSSGPVYFAIQNSLKSVFPDALVAPSISTGATDSRHYSNLAKEIYRFRPFTLVPDELSMIHGVNERVKVEDLRKAVRVYEHLIQEL
ncbi:MAG: M20/M25/M40 family metallo-hydrolase [Pseudobdellovibrionaceae bacterium]